MECQLALATDAAERRPAVQRLETWLVKRASRIAHLARRAVSDPAAALRRLAGVPARGPSRGEAAPIPPLRLAPGDRVRVKSLQAIRGTLDARGQYRGLAFMPEMERFAGRELLVKKRVELFFDERTRQMRRLRGCVILEGALCEGQRSDPWDYAGCDRSCFLFWKEAWLERAS